MSDMPFSDYRPDLMGSARINVESPVTCGAWTTLELVYTAGHFGIDDLGGLKISFRSASDQTPPQFDQPKAPGYTTVTASNGARLNASYSKNSNIRPWGNTLHIKCLNFLSEGDTITVRLGDKSGGSPGTRMQTFREYAHEYRVHVDAFATYDFVVLPPERQPIIALLPGPVARHIAILPTLRQVGEDFALGLKAEDLWGNPTDADQADYTLHSSMPVEGLPKRISMIKAIDGVLRLEGLRVKHEGDLRVEMLNDAGQCVARSNSLRLQDVCDTRHYWSDMHGQSGETVGTNTARQYFAFGRDKALIDICGHQGNDFQITDSFWADLNQLTAEFDEPGRFLAVPGYEWSGNTSVGGDHNVWYRTEGRPIYRAHRALVMEDSTDENVCLDAKELFARLKDEDALVVAHVGGRYADISFAHDAKLEPSVEVHSAWGTFDWIFEDARKAGYRVGIVAASDGHKGRVGASYPGAGKFGSLGGLTCHLMSSLDRDSLFSAFRRRRHYATTGCRPFIDVRVPYLKDAMCRVSDTESESVSTALIGDILTCKNDEAIFTFDIAAQSGIERIDIKDGLTHLKRIQPESEARKIGSRLRIQCEGAEYRGRGRLVNWDVEVKSDGPAIRKAAPINFWNSDNTVFQDSHSVRWKNVTTGGFHAVDIWLEDATTGVLTVLVNGTEIAVDLRTLGTDDLIHDFGGLQKAIRLFRLPDTPLANTYNDSLSVPLTHGEERCLFLRVTFEDGHVAWTSPIYLLRN
ncbi:MAG TPA: DUF3604 domain-containing protein [Gammaproteobacteria bacterium]|jgi:hypothetical protein|nr:DUF3604 domain-containing protein [Gammaproteobacteria bacterium]|tara:strand:- start:118 stop:2364 length:2247 start_codon:yes stop_codon:yes gene_type:complete